MLVPRSAEDRAIRQWLRRGEAIRLSSLAWAEVLCGPVSTLVVEEAAEFLGEPLPFDGIDATLAAQLFNGAGRRRGSLVDCMIAAVAIRADARLATTNPTDFQRFSSLGLALALGHRG